MYEICSYIQQSGSKSMQQAYHPQIQQSVICENLMIEEGDEIQHYPLNYYELGRYQGRCLLGQYYEARKYRGFFKENLGVTILLKQIKSQNIEEAERIYKNEIRTLGLLKVKANNYFVKCFSYWKQQGKFYIALEKCQYGSLKKFTEYLSIKNQTLDELQIIYIMREILRAVQSLHQIGIVHGELKTQNIAIGDNLNIKLLDFSLSKIDKYQPIINASDCGTPNYMAPEHLSQKQMEWGFQSDIWSIGVVLFYLLYKKYPLSAGSLKDFKKKLRKNDRDIVVKTQLDEILQIMLNFNFKDRKNAEELLSNKIFLKITDQKKVKENLLNLLNQYLKDSKVKDFQWRCKIDQTQIKHSEDIKNVILSKYCQKTAITLLIYEKKYGYFILLSNLKVIAYFNNQKLLIFEKSFLTCAKSNEEKVISWIYGKYFQSIILSQSSKDKYKQLLEPACTIKNLIIINETICIRLSNDVFQVFVTSTAEEINKLKKSDSYQYLNYIRLNYNTDKHSQIEIKLNHKSFLYENFQKGLLSQHRKYFEYIRLIFQTTLNNSMISKLRHSAQ